jgi:uncharacterized protein (TIGR01440 family)
METKNLVLEDIKKNLPVIAAELIEAASLKEGSLLVLGCSSSELVGRRIGKGSSLAVGYQVVKTLLSVLKPLGINLAVQGCEHINRSLVVERAAMIRNRLTEVSVVPALHAGGSAALAAYALADDPVMVEAVSADAGIDIGETSIGQYVKFVQVPFRQSMKTLGAARVTCLRTRPRLVGGVRACYEFDRKAWESELAEEEA